MLLLYDIHYYMTRLSQAWRFWICSSPGVQRKQDNSFPFNRGKQLSVICTQQQSGGQGLICSFVAYDYLSKYLFDIYNPMSASRSPAIAMRESRPGSVGNQIVQTWHTIFPARILHIFFFSLFSQARTARWRRRSLYIFVFHLKSHLMAQVSVSSRVCGVTTVESSLQGNDFVFAGWNCP